MHTVTHFLVHSDPLLFYLIVVVALLLESAAVPIVNSTLVLLAGALASSGHLNIGDVAVAAIIGSILGACLAYLIGAYGGHRFLVRIVSLLRMNRQKVDIVEHWCKRSGAWMIFFSRMTPYVRPFACFPAGITRMPFARFFAAASGGSIIWCISMLAVGWYLGRRWTLAVYLMQRYTLITLAIIALLIAAYVVITNAIKRHLRTHYREHVSREAHW